jgi:hypothetical protein
LSALNHIERICWQHNGFVCNISTRQYVVDKSVGGKSCRLAVDLLATQGFAVDLPEICLRFAIEAVSQQVYSKSPANPCYVV